MSERSIFLFILDCLIHESLVPSPDVRDHNASHQVLIRFLREDSHC
jgi:hypothetical protein